MIQMSAQTQMLTVFLYGHACSKCLSCTDTHTHKHKHTAVWSCEAGHQSAPLASGCDCHAAEWLVITHCMHLNFTLFKIISSVLQPFSKYKGDLQSKSCWRKDSCPAVWQQAVGVAVERTGAFRTGTFLWNNCPVMTASSRVLCKRVSHFFSALYSRERRSGEWENSFFKVNTALLEFSATQVKVREVCLEYTEGLFGFCVFHSVVSQPNILQFGSFY